MCDAHQGSRTCLCACTWTRQRLRCSGSGRRAPPTRAQAPTAPPAPRVGRVGARLQQVNRRVCCSFRVCLKGRPGIMQGALETSVCCSECSFVCAPMQQPHSYRRVWHQQQSRCDHSQPAAALTCGSADAEIHCATSDLREVSQCVHNMSTLEQALTISLHKHNTGLKWHTLHMAPALLCA